MVHQIIGLIFAADIPNVFIVIIGGRSDVGRSEEV